MNASPARPDVARVGALVALLFVILYVLPLGLRPLLLPDEFRYAEVPREMLASGDWVVPRMNGVHYFEKPVLGYWLTAVSEATLGRNRFAVRLPSALAAGLTALLVGLLARRAGQAGEASGALAGTVFLTSALSVALGTTVVLDMPLTLFLTATIATFFLATRAPAASARERALLLLSGASCGLAFLTKGFLAPVLAALVGGGYLVWQRRWRDLVRLPWLPLSGAALVSAPWSLAVHSRAPDYWRFFFWHEHVQRFLAAESEAHPEPWWLLLAAAPLVLLPWTFLLPAAGAGLWKERTAARDAVRLCIVWTLVVFGFFSASSGKLVTYVLPALPPIAILVSLGLAGTSLATARARRWGALVGALLVGLVAVGLAGYLLGPGRDHPDLLRPGSWGLAGGLAAAAAILGVAARTRSARRSSWIFACTLVPFLTVAQLALPARVQLNRAPGAFLAAHRDEIGPQTIVIADSGTARAVCWVLERDDIYLLGSPGELTYGMVRDPTRGQALGFDDARRMIAEHPGRVVVITERRYYNAWRQLLPEPASEHSTDPRYGFVLARF